MKPVALYTQGAAILMTVGIASAQLAVFATMLDQWSLTPLWWNALVLVGVLAALVLGALAAVGRLACRWPALLHVGWTTVALLSLGTVSTGTYRVTDPPWVEVFAITAVAVSVLVSTRWWLAALSAATVLAAQRFAQVQADWLLPSDQVVGDLVYGISLFGMCLAVVMALATTEHRLRAEATAASASYAQARAAEQAARHEAQWDALVHDQVLAALEAAVQTGGRTVTAAATAAGSGEARDLAARAAHSLEVGPDCSETDPARLQDELLQVVLQLCPMAETWFPAVASAQARLPVPSEVRKALLLAVGEALRNVVAHAYPDGGLGPVLVELRHDEDSVMMRVEDRGVGFRRHEVSVTSFGLALSIEQRMDAVGGRAEVHSEPGSGTTVTLQWQSARPRRQG